MATSITQIGVQPQKKTRNKGFFRAQYASSVISAPTSIASVGIISAMKKASTVSKADSVSLIKAAQEGLQQTGLKDKGVRTYLLESINIGKLPKNQAEAKQFIEAIPEFIEKLKPSKKDQKAIGAFKEELMSSKKFQILSKQLSKIFEKLGLTDSDKIMLDKATKTQMLQFKLGLNACYLPNANKIILPDKALQTSVFHEMGHALNNNGGKLLKNLQKLRPLAMTVPAVILMVSLLNKRKTTDEKSDNKIQNLFDGIKKNAGKITALAMLPMVAEEGIASLRGDKIARNLVKDGKLTKNLLKQIRKTNALGFASYALVAITTVATAKFAIRIKDNIQAKYEQKQLLKSQKVQA